MGNFLKNNCCDGIYNSIDIHFTSACDNKCAHCIDSRFHGVGCSVPDVDAIVASVVENAEKYDDVLFLGGEPCLFLEELYECVCQIKEKTDLKVYTTTSVPRVCYEKRDLFERLIRKLDGLNISVQHHNECVADQIRRTESKYDRQSFYRSLPYREKIRVNLNIVKPFLYTSGDIIECLKHYDDMGFNSIKISEIQHGKDQFVSFEKLFGLNLGSPYSRGCQKYINMEELIAGFKTPVLLKRSCFVCESTLKATPLDGIKVLSKLFLKPKNNYSVIYGNGETTKGWV